jgi:GTP-binding protein
MVGRSNVGKSTLLNAVVKRKAVARVSQTPGKTQAVQFYLVNERFYIVDLPGYGFAKVPREIARSWGDLVRAYLEESDALRLIFLLLDVRRLPSDEDLEMRDWVDAAGIEKAIVLTKSDKLSKNELIKQRKEIARTYQRDADDLIPFSIVTKSGIEQIRREITSRI